MKQKTLFRVTVQSHESVYEVYARSVCEAELFGFIAIEELVFGDAQGQLNHSSVEQMRAEFTGVKSTFVPMHNILRIDEIEENAVQVVESPQGSNVSQFPPLAYTKLPDNFIS